MNPVRDLYDFNRGYYQLPFTFKYKLSVRQQGIYPGGCWDCNTAFMLEDKWYNNPKRTYKARRLYWRSH